MEKRNYEVGVIVTLIAALLSSLIVKAVGSFALGSLAGTLLALCTAAISVIYFGIDGLRTISVGYKGIPLLFGKRIEGIVYPEGMVWTWPKPIGDVIAVDTRDKPIDLPLSEVLTEDSVPVSITVALQIKVTNLFKYLDADKPEASLANATESDIRSIALCLQSGNIAQERQNIINTLTTGKGSDATPLEGLLFQGLSDSEKLWGIKVTQVRITHIRLPKELEDAKTDIQVRESRQKAEEADARSEMTEAKHIAEMMAVYKAAGLSPTEAMRMLQGERGKATNINIDGSADPIIKAGALAGGLFGKSPNASSSSPDNKGQRRRA